MIAARAPQVVLSVVQFILIEIGLRLDQLQLSLQGVLRALLGTGDRFLQALDFRLIEVHLRLRLLQPVGNGLGRGRERGGMFRRFLKRGGERKVHFAVGDAQSFARPSLLLTAHGARSELLRRFELILGRGDQAIGRITPIRRPFPGLANWAVRHHEANDGGDQKDQ